MTGTGGQAAQPLVTGLVDHGHPARADPCLDPVLGHQ
jgi:hypothetical protein